MATPYAKRFKDYKDEFLEIARRKGVVGLSFHIRKRFGVAGYIPAVESMLTDFTKDPEFVNKLNLRRNGDGTTPGDFIEATVEIITNLKELTKRQALTIKALTEENEELKDRLNQMEYISHAKIKGAMEKILS